MKPKPIKNPGSPTNTGGQKAQGGISLGAHWHAGGRTGSETCGPSLISSIQACSEPRKSSPVSPNVSRRSRTVSHQPLRELVRPYILRRLKTDKTVIADLPDKTEIKAFCPLSRSQAALYQQAVKDLAEQLEDSSGIQRRGLVLSFLMRFKQICNHPFAVARGWLVERSRQRKVCAAAGDCRSDRR